MYFSFNYFSRCHKERPNDHSQMFCHLNEDQTSWAVWHFLIVIMPKNVLNNWHFNNFPWYRNKLVRLSSTCPHQTCKWTYSRSSTNFIFLILCSIFCNLESYWTHNAAFNLSIQDIQIAANCWFRSQCTNCSWYLSTNKHCDSNTYSFYIGIKY